MSAPAHYQWRRVPFIRNPLLRYGFIIAVIAYLVWAISTLDFNWARISEGVTRAGRIFGGGFPPDFSRRSLIITGFVESIQRSEERRVGRGGRSQERAQQRRRSK